MLGYPDRMLNLENELKQIKNAGLYRKLVTMSSQSGPRMKIDNREVLMLSSNDYLGLCSHPRLKKQAQQALDKWGAGSGASRLISGNLAPFVELEHNLADFKQTEDALVFSTGYMANTGLLSALAGPTDVIFSDQLNHASIIDGCRLSRARIEVYSHRDVGVLESLLKKKGGPANRIIVTDGVFSMDGDIAPVPDLFELAQKYDAALVIDDAHSTGVLGKQGKGTLEYFNMCATPEITVMGTLGKALGCFGAFVAGSRNLKEFLINRSRSFIFTTALPASVVAAALEALEILEDEPQLRHNLHRNVSFMHQGLSRLGFETGSGRTHIVPLIIGAADTAVAMARHLLDEGLFIQAIRPPTVPEGSSRLRITVMATHTIEDLAKALDILSQAGKRFGII